MADVKPLKLDSGIIKQMGTGDTLPVANGGTGATTLTDNGVLIGNGTGAVDVTAAGATGEVLVGVTGGNPVFGSWLPQAKCKTADESVTSSTTYQDDDTFVFNVAANETWVVNGFIQMSCAASGGMKFDLAVPSGASGYLSVTVDGLAWTNGAAIGTGGGNNAAVSNDLACFSAYVVNSSTSGVIQLRWAQNISNGTASIVKRSSTLVATRVS